MNKKRLLMGMAAALVITALAGGSLAYFSATGSKVQQNINTQTLGIEFSYGENAAEVQSAESAFGADEITVKAMPGKSYVKEVAVKNTEEVSLYARVKIRKYWIDGDGKDLGKDPEKIRIISDEANGSWIIEDQDKEEIVMYYTKPLAAGEETSFFMNEIEISHTIGNDYADAAIRLDLTTDGVQTYAAEDAILSEWGVAAEINSDGTISRIIE